MSQERIDPWWKRIVLGLAALACALTVTRMMGTGVAKTVLNLLPFALALLLGVAKSGST